MRRAPPDMQTIHVVAAVLTDGQNRVLIAQRPAGKSMAGYWEFPGGKLEAGETSLVGLKRELHEELGVTVRNARPLIRLSHAYPEVRVQLDVWRVIHYNGDLHACEDQPLAWVKPRELSRWNLLPADGPIITAIQFPPLMLVTPSPAAHREQFLQTLEHVLKHGVDFVQLRAPELSLPDYASLASPAIAICHRQGVRIVLNTEPKVARDLGADGVHLSNARLSRLTERPMPEDFLVGASCHDETGIRLASAHGLDYLILGPVQATPSHPHGAILGWDGFKRLALNSTLPVYAIGGMLPEYLEQVRDLGGHGIAAMRGLWEAQGSASS
ncbi:MAG TPA: Nudix family hydrolase [Gammaproteobacteria bacterium]|nr:Nudix family hydrolase [Gammaproteobacteria bacterium]